jgi:hypothetical protein
MLTDIPAIGICMLVHESCLQDISNNSFFRICINKIQCWADDQLDPSCLNWVPKYMESKQSYHSHHRNIKKIQLHLQLINVHFTHGSTNLYLIIHWRTHIQNVHSSHSVFFLLLNHRTGITWVGIERTCMTGDLWVTCLQQWQKL